MFTAFAVGSLALELGAPLGVLNRKAGRLWALATFGMHWGISRHHGHPVPLSAVRSLLRLVVLLQVATLSIYHWCHLPENGWRALLGDASLPAYQFWLISGALAGLHVQRWHEWAMRNWYWLLGAFPVATTLLMWSYLVQLETREALGASSPLQPIMIMWSVATLGVLYLASVHVVRLGSPAVRTMVSHGARLSFGIYLAHPLVLDVLLAVLRRLDLVAPSAWVALGVALLTVGATTAFCAAAQYSRFSSALIGKPRLTRVGAHPSR